jgi:hypothetical protein
MKSNDIFIAHPHTADQVTALKAFMQALKIKFEIAQEDTYNPDFVKKIKASKKQIIEGKYTRVKSSDIEDFVNSL